MPTKKPRICVVGSINMDLVVRCDTLPSPGETRIADSTAEICGGKGANQAVAAVRAGGDVSMIGRVGDDGFAGRLVANLQHEGIDCSHVMATENCPSGLAIVSVESSGQNSILVSSGANGHVDAADLARAKDLITGADILLVQLEIPIATVVAAVDLAHVAGVRVILDPAPAPTAFPASLFGADLICPNETEAAAILGMDVASIDGARRAADEFQKRGAKNVAITLGEKGTMFAPANGEATLIPSHAIETVDTTAAGDAFAGALAVCWAEGNELPDAVRFANRAGAISASRPGAQPSMACRDELQASVIAMKRMLED